MPAYVDNMVFAGETPWHGLGTPLTGEESVEEMLQKAGLDWEVAMLPIKLATEDEKLIPSHRAAVNVSTGKVLGVVGNRWEPLQNRDAFAIFEPLVESGELAWHTAGSLKGGKRVWVLCSINVEPADIVPGDTVCPFVLLSHGHDGKLAVHFGLTPIRVVCANTEAAARGHEHSKLIRLIHSRRTKARLEELRDMMDLTRRNWQQTVDQYKFLASRYYTPESALEYFERVVFGKVAPAQERPTRRENLLKEITAIMVGGRGSSITEAQGTWWEVYNGVTEYLSHHASRKQETRLDNLFFGPKTQRALDLAIEYAGAA